MSLYILAVKAIPVRSYPVEAAAFTKLHIYNGNNYKLISNSKHNTIMAVYLYISSYLTEFLCLYFHTAMITSFNAFSIFNQ